MSIKEHLRRSSFWANIGFNHDDSSLMNNFIDSAFFNGVVAEQQPGDLLRTTNNCGSAFGGPAREEKGDLKRPLVRSWLLQS